MHKEAQAVRVTAPPQEPPKPVPQALFPGEAEVPLLKTRKK